MSGNVSKLRWRDSRTSCLHQTSFSLQLVGQPAQDDGVKLAEAWFLYRTYTGARHVAQKSVFEVLGDGTNKSASRYQPRLGPTRCRYVVPADRLLYGRFDSSVLYMCSICALARPQVVFEILDSNRVRRASLRRLTDLPRPRSLRSIYHRRLLLGRHQDDRNGRRAHPADIGVLSGMCATSIPKRAKFSCSMAIARWSITHVSRSESPSSLSTGPTHTNTCDRDRLNALSCCHGGSVIAWHDYGRSGVNGVSRWVDELSRDYEIYSVSGGSLAFTVPR